MIDKDSISLILYDNFLSEAIKAFEKIKVGITWEKDTVWSAAKIGSAPNLKFEIGGG